jgi:hypothetical protein
VFITRGSKKVQRNVSDPRGKSEERSGVRIVSRFGLAIVTLLNTSTFQYYTSLKFYSKSKSGYNATTTTTTNKS